MENDEKGETRRDFMTHLAGGLVTLSVAGTWTAARALAAEARPATALATLKIDEYQQLQQVGGNVVLKKTPVGDLLIVRSGESEYSAMSVVCPHLQCNVKVKSPALIQCPCHQSGYKLDGTYISGPAKSGLRRFPLTVDGGEITVWEEKPQEK